MTDLFDDPDQYEDVEFAASTCLVWGFTLNPFDATGSTVAFILNGTSFPMTFTLDDFGGTIFGPVSLSPTQTAAVGLVNKGDLGSYVVFITYATGVIQRIGHGEVLVV